MITLNTLRSEHVRVVTFDCYGTLVDWETGIWTAFRETADADGVHLDRDRLIETYHAVEAMVEKGAYRPYREVLRETARRVAAECGWSIDPGRASFLPESLPEWPPFPDTNPALERISGSYRLGILSNVDSDLLDATCRSFTVPFDFRVTADRVESYKPDLAHFEAARPYVGTAGGWLHVAASLYHDVGPANTVGVPVVWVNRAHEDSPSESPLPDREVPDLLTLVEWLAGS